MKNLFLQKIGKILGLALMVGSATILLQTNVYAGNPGEGNGGNSNDNETGDAHQIETEFDNSVSFSNEGEFVQQNPNGEPVYYTPAIIYIYRFPIAQNSAQTDNLFGAQNFNRILNAKPKRVIAKINPRACKIREVISKIITGKGSRCRKKLLIPGVDYALQKMGLQKMRRDEFRSINKFYNRIAAMSMENQRIFLAFLKEYYTMQINKNIS